MSLIAIGFCLTRTLTELVMSLSIWEPASSWRTSCVRATPQASILFHLLQLTKWLSSSAYNSPGWPGLGAEPSFSAF